MSGCGPAGDWAACADWRQVGKAAAQPLHMPAQPPFAITCRMEAAADAQHIPHGFCALLCCSMGTASYILTGTETAMKVGRKQGTGRFSNSFFAGRSEASLLRWGLCAGELGPSMHSATLASKVRYYALACTLLLPPCRRHSAARATARAVP